MGSGTLLMLFDRKTYSYMVSQVLNKQYQVPVSDDIIEKHLRGSDERGHDFTIGVYPMLEDETCFFLAVDFFSQLISTSRIFVRMYRHFFSLADGSTFPPPWKDPVPEMVHTSGFSSLRQFPPVQLAAWAAFS